MKSIIFVTVICSVIVNSWQFFIITDELEREIRHKRDTSINVQGQGSQATGLTLGESGNIQLGGGGSHVLTGGGLVHKTVNGPVSVGGELGYSHDPSGTSVKATALETPVWGKDVNLEFSKTLFNEGGARLDAFAGAQQHFGGLPGNQAPQGNAGIRFEYRPPPPPTPDQLPDDISRHICLFMNPSSNNCH